MSNQGYSIKRSFQTIQLFQNRSQSMLDHIEIELTERCNSDCLHCYINLPKNDSSAKNQELTTQGWKTILDQAAKLGALYVRFSGGEPLLREDFTELYCHARFLGMMVMIFTNARLITPELANLFSEIPPLKKIEVSAYGIHKNSYNAFTRSKNGFCEFQSGLQLLLDRNIPFIIKPVILPPNENEILEFEAWATNHPGIIQSNYAYYLDLRARRDSPTKNQLIKNLRITPQQGLLLETHNQDSFYREILHFCTHFLYPQGDQLFSCGAGQTGCVDAYGQYQMCTLLRHPDFTYDLSTGTLYDALNRFFPKFLNLRAKNSDYINRCARCFLKSLCGQCPGRSWIEHGNLDTPIEYLCQVAHEKAIFIGLLNPGEVAWEISNWQERIENLQELKTQDVL